MPDFHTIPIDSIVIGDRFRKENDGSATSAITYLRDDIARHGLYHPLVVTRTERRLLVGGRRLAAMRLLGWSEVPVQFFDEVDDATAREIELEENLARKDLTWQERCRLVEEITKLKEAIYGKTANQYTKPDGWNQSRTAEMLGVRQPIVSQDLRLANALKVVPSLVKETSRANALRAVDRLEEDIQRELARRAQLAEHAKFDSNVICGDATSLILSLPNESVDCIITDPPYGLDQPESRRAKRDGWAGEENSFDDSPESAIAVIRSIAPQLRRVLKPAGHFYAFHSHLYGGASLSIWRAAGFDVRDLPNIWIKPGGATGTADWDHNFAAAWEPFFFASNRQRRLAFKRKNVFTYAVELGAARLHPTQKPVELLRELIQLSTEPNEVVLDPFCGSGSTLVAASQLRRKFLGYELSERYCAIARQRLVNEGREQPYIFKPEP